MYTKNKANREYRGRRPPPCLSSKTNLVTRLATAELNRLEQNRVYCKIQNVEDMARNTTHTQNLHRQKTERIQRINVTLYCEKE